MYFRERRRPRHALGTTVNSTKNHWTLLDYSRGRIETTDPEIARRHADRLSLAWGLSVGLLALCFRHALHRASLAIRASAATITSL